MKIYGMSWKFDMRKNLAWNRKTISDEHRLVKTKQFLHFRGTSFDKYVLCHPWVLQPKNNHVTSQTTIWLATPLSNSDHSLPGLSLNLLYYDYSIFYINFNTVYKDIDMHIDICR